jgi:hypothetical protein
MPKFVQEKYQVNYPGMPVEDAPGDWVHARTVRVKKGTPGREGRPGGDPTSRYSDLTANYNSLPPGMDIEDQEMADLRKFNESISGSFPQGHNAGDVTQNLTAKSGATGFKRLECCPTDDMYTREHNDAFYDDPEVDGQHGFVERNNYLDRL